MSKPNVDFNNIDVSKLIVPAWLYELQKSEDFIEHISEPQLIPYSEIDNDTENPGREKGVRTKAVDKLATAFERNGWMDDTEVCVVIEVKNPNSLSTIKYQIRFTLHRHGAGWKVQEKHGVIDPVLPCTVVTLKDGLSESQIEQAIAMMADIENDETSKKPHEDYTIEDRAYAWMKYVKDYKEPGEIETADQHKYNYLVNHYVPKLEKRGLHHKTRDAVLAHVLKKLNVYTPMVYYGNKAARKTWATKYNGQFEYCGNKIVQLQFDNKKTNNLLRPFGDREERFIEYWKEDDDNRDFGNLIEKVSKQLEDKIDTPIMVFLDCNKASGETDLKTKRYARVESIERRMKLISEEARSLVHFVAFMPHLKDKEDITSLISYSEVKEEFESEK
jgi:hypothetical protein